MVVQIELQRQGTLWYLKGCTAYAADGRMWPIAVVPAAFPSRGVALRAMKHLVRAELTSPGSQIPLQLKWQVVLWFPGTSLQAPGPSETCDDLSSSDDASGDVSPVKELTLNSPSA